METVKVAVNYIEKASRAEIFIRLIWASICGIMLLGMAVIIIPAAIFQTFYILVYGKRDYVAHIVIANWLVAFANVGFYKNMCTDERPPLFPEIL